MMLRSNLFLPLNEQPFWYRVVAGVLSLLYGLVVSLRNFLYDKAWIPTMQLPGMCISVGNISVGGTGKSPFVMDLAQQMLKNHFHPVILTHGYKSSLKKGEIIVLLGGKLVNKSFHREIVQLPDEAMMYSQKLPTVPIVVARNRAKAAQWYLKESSQPSHWILDDGFQHRKIDRDLEIVLLDAQSPFGNTKLLPLGILREPLRSLKRSHCVCFTRADLKNPLTEHEKFLRRYTPAPTVKLFFDFVIRPLNETMRFTKENEAVLVMCGIAQPDKFLGQIREKNIAIGNTYIVDDHDAFDGKKMQEALTNCKSILTTEKDYWRTPELFNNAGKPVFIADLRIFPTETDKESIFEVICRLQKRPRMDSKSR